MFGRRKKLEMQLLKGLETRLIEVDKLAIRNRCLIADLDRRIGPAISPDGDEKQISHKDLILGALNRISFQEQAIHQLHTEVQAVQKSVASANKPRKVKRRKLVGSGKKRR